MKIIDKIIKKLYYETSSGRLITYYRNQGIRIGDRTHIFCPKDIVIDTTRPELIEIGNHVFLHKGTRIFSHDWAGWCFVDKYNDFIPSHRKVKIGNNVWLGENVSILGGANIGNDVIIGYGAIVTKDIPSNSVAVGTPAKVICSLDEFYKKRKEDYASEALQYGVEIVKMGKELTKDSFYDDYPCFVDKENYREYDYPYNRIFSKSQFGQWLNNHKKQFDGFEDFVANVIKVRDSE